MCAAPARVAGVEELVLCVPPGRDGHVAEETLAAACIAGVDEVYRIGGAQAVAAMAYGTESIRPVDVIVGPGNRYVAEAKRQVAGIVGVPAGLRRSLGGRGGRRRGHAGRVRGHRHRGPGRARPRRPGLAGRPGRSRWPDAVTAEVERLVAESPRRAELEATLGSGGYAVLVDGPSQALAVANVVAPEHLELMVEDAESLAAAGPPGRGRLPRPLRTRQRG